MHFISANIDLLYKFFDFPMECQFLWKLSLEMCIKHGRGNTVVDAYSYYFPVTKSNKPRINCDCSRDICHIFPTFRICSLLQTLEFKKFMQHIYFKQNLFHVIMEKKFLCRNMIFNKLSGFSLSHSF